MLKSGYVVGGQNYFMWSFHIVNLLQKENSSKQVKHPPQISIEEMEIKLKSLNVSNLLFNNVVIPFIEKTH
jgi:hypothetical protein